MQSSKSATYLIFTIKNMTKEGTNKKVTNYVLILFR